MRVIKLEELERLRKEYPNGTRVELVKMDDSQAPPLGTHGTVYGVDDTGSMLSVILEAGDIVRKAGDTEWQIRFLSKL